MTSCRFPKKSERTRMKTTFDANESWEPEADFSVNGGGLHPWLADLDINTVIDMNDEEVKAAKERYENHS